MTQYGLMMAALDKEHGGVFKYLADAIDHAVVTGEDLFAMDDEEEYVFFDYQVLGLTERPAYFTKFKVKVEDYVNGQFKIPAGQEAEAMISALHKEKDSLYAEALKEIIATNTAAQKKYEEDCEAAALAAIKGANKGHTGDDGERILHPLSDAGRSACTGVTEPPPPQPSMDEMQAQAKERASQQLKDYAANANLARIAKEGSEKEKVKKEKKEKEQAAKAEEIAEKARVQKEKEDKKEAEAKAVAERTAKAELKEKAAEKQEKEAARAVAEAKQKHDEAAEKKAAELEAKAHAKELEEKAEVAKTKEIADKKSAEIKAKGECVPVITTHTSATCSRDDCRAKASCPTGTAPLRCEVAGSNNHAGDGAYWSENLECVAQGSDLQAVAAKVTCTSCVTETTRIESASSYKDAQLLSADCPSGTNVVDCNCVSAWKASNLCPGTEAGRFNPVDGSCSLMIPTSPGRRRNVGAGAGSKISALCNKAPVKCVPKLTTHTSASCTGDDCKAKVACPIKTAPVKCKTVGNSNGGDGAYIEKDTLQCVAQGANGQEPISAEVTCTSCPTETSVEVSANTYLDDRVVTATCPSDMQTVDCNCVTAWRAASVCPGSSMGRFSPTDGKCSLNIPVSSGRRRGQGWGAGAMIYALCNKDVPVCKKVVTKHTSVSCTGDDCTTKISCPSNAAPITCRAVGSTAGDGAYVNKDLECEARASNSVDAVSAEVTCSTCATQTVSKVSASTYLDAQTVTASCPDDFSLLDCNCHTPWQAKNLCPGTTEGRFDGNTAENKCSLKIPVSPGRRRGSRLGAGAMIYALCSKNAGA